MDRSIQLNHLTEIGPGFYNLRGKFTFLMGLIDIGTHMSFIKLNDGRFLIIDTCEISQSAKQEIDLLTQNGALMAAVVATHPFHTVYFKAFYEMYPNVPFYGTPRHMKRIRSIPWVGDMSHPATLQLWEPDISMRIPEGAEFVNPTPENNHFSNVFVYHHASKTLFNDDTVMFFQNPGCVLRCAGAAHDSMTLHSTIKSCGLLPARDASDRFKSWFLQILSDWDIENICTAHNGSKLGGASQLMRETLTRFEPVLLSHAQNHKDSPTCEELSPTTTTEPLSEAIGGSSTTTPLNPHQTNQL